MEPTRTAAPHPLTLADRWLAAAPGVTGALVAVVALGAGLLTIDGGFVYDDRLAIETSPVVQGEVGLREAWTARDFWGRPLGSAAKVSWRPLLPTIWRWLWALGDGAAWPLRLLSAALHAGATLLAWRALRLAWPGAVGPAGVPAATLAVLAALLFALHPIHAETIGGLVGNADAVASCGVFAAWIIALGGLSARRLVAATLVVGIAAMAKESALLGLVVVAASLVGRRPSRRAVGAFGLAAAIVAGATLLMVARAHGGAEQPQDNVLVTLAAGARLVTALAIVARGALALLAAWEIAPSHSYAVYDADVGDEWLSAALGAGVLFACAHAGWRAIARRDGVAAAAVVLVAGPVVAASNLLFVAPTEFAERALHGAALVPAAALAIGLLRLTALRPRLGLAAAVVTVALAATLLTTLARPWRDQRSLFAHAVAAEPRSWRHHHNLGDALARAGDVPAGLWHLLLGVHLRQTLPHPPNWPMIAALQREALAERILLAPAALAPADPCRLIGAVIGEVWGGPRFAAQARQAWAVFASRYRCDPGPSAR